MRNKGEGDFTLELATMGLIFLGLVGVIVLFDIYLNEMEKKEREKVDEMSEKK